MDILDGSIRRRAPSGTGRHRADPKSQPYGIVALNGAIWYVESAIKPNNVLVRFDIKTEKFQSWIIPGGGGVVRNIKTTDDGNIVMAESGVNKIALVEVGEAATAPRRTRCSPRVRAGAP